MTLRFEGIGRIGFLTLIALASCSESDANPEGAGGGTGGGAAGTSTTAGMTSTSGSGGAGMAGTSSNGGGSAGTTSAGSNAGGTTAGAGGTTAGAGGAAGTGGGGGSGGAKSKTTFFVTSDTSKTGNLGGLTGADKRCQDLAQAAGFGDHTWKAYLSTTTENAKARIGEGPWVNAKGDTVAMNLTELHALKGNAQLFVDEKGMPIDGQWNGSSGADNHHDILTGSSPTGELVAGKNCMDWTSADAGLLAMVGHSDGMGPGMATTGTYSSWNSSHENGSCADTAPKGGAGKIYCFASD
jgi:hypothetical protein